jgi:hypothetical protein
MIRAPRAVSIPMPLIVITITSQEDHDCLI